MHRRQDSQGCLLALLDAQLRVSLREKHALLVRNVEIEGDQEKNFHPFLLLFPNLKRNWKSYRGCLAPFFLFSAVVALLASLLLRCVFLYADVMLALLRLAPPPTPPSSRCAFPNLSSSTAPIDARGGAQARWSRFQFFLFYLGFSLLFRVRVPFRSLQRRDTSARTLKLHGTFLCRNGCLRAYSFTPG